MSDFMKKPCEHCPYREDIKPFLHPERGSELAFAAQNRYQSFPCHKTTESDDEGMECQVVAHTKVCAGFLSLQHNENGRTAYDEDGFEPSPLVYETSYDMSDAYEDAATVKTALYEPALKD
jgi:hypothetical protein